MNSDFTPALTRGISEFCLYEQDQMEDFAGPFFHDEEMDGAYEDEVNMVGVGLPGEHFPLQRVGVDGIQTSFTVRYLARSFTLGIVIAIEDKQDDLYGIIHKFFPAAGGEFARSYHALHQILAAQFFGLYGFQTGTAVPFSADGVGMFSASHPYSSFNANTWSNTASAPADLSIAIGQMMEAGIRTQKRPNAIQPLANKLVRVMCHPNERIVAEQIFNSDVTPFTADHEKNNLSKLGVQVVANPYWEYSGVTQPNVAFNSYFGQGTTHYCKWKNRMNLALYSRFDNTVMGDIITTLERFGYGYTSALGTWGNPGA